MASSRNQTEGMDVIRIACGALFAQTEAAVATKAPGADAPQSSEAADSCAHLRR